MSRASVPSTYRAWQLFGAGFDNIGKNGGPVELPLLAPRENEILFRTDAIGLCLSDIKIIKLGNEHPRLSGRDLASEPTVLGHECSGTVVQVGERWKDRFHPGERYIVQADIYYHGEGYAFGYRIPGGLGEYFYLDERAIEGDEGCYLLPVQSQTGFSQAALTEPWACVEMSYNLDDALAPNENDVVLRDATPEKLLGASKQLKKDARVFILGVAATDGSVSLDIGRIHYEGLRFLGGGTTVEEVAQANARHDLLPGGAALFIGGAGPMGQMHVQRAIERANGPRLVVVTDLEEYRLQHVRDRFGTLAQSKGVTLRTLVPSKAQGNDELRALAPDGYDDIVIMAPAAGLVTALMPLAADRALINVFAGVPIGSFADVRLSDLCRGIKIIGSSGSRIRDMQAVLDMVERRELNTNLSVAAIGGLNAAKTGLEGLRDARFPGKTVIYPQLPDLPLMSIEEAAQSIPELNGKLSPEGAWTTEAEQALLNLVALGSGT